MTRIPFIILCLIWGSSFILMKQATEAFGPIGVGAYRTLSGAAVLGVILLIRRPKWTLRREQTGPILLLSLVGYVYAFSMQPYLIHKTQNSSFIGMIVSFVPLFTIIVSAPMLKIRPTKRELTGVLGGLAGLILIYWVSREKSISLMCLILALTVPAVYAASNAYIKRTFAGADPMQLACVALLGGGMMMLPMSLYSETIVVDANFAKSLGALLILGILGTGIANYLFFHMLQLRGPLYAGMVTYVVPTLALIWGWSFGESISGIQIAALVFTLSMVGLVQGDHPNQVENESTP